MAVKEKLMSTRFVATVLAATLSTSAFAAQITDPTGASDFYIEYNEATGELFGTPFLRNNTIFFLPSEFFAESTNGEGPVNTFDTIQLHLIATTPGFSFDSFSLNEEGDYKLDGADASVQVDGRMMVRDFNNPTMSISTAINADAPLTIASGRLEDWTASASIDASTGWMAGLTDVNLTLENFLTAETTQFGSVAFIEKKFEGVRIDVNPVPLPGALWLFAPALLALWRRRKA